MKREREAIVRGTAMIAPVGTHVRMGNENNMSSKAKLACDVHVKPVSADDGLPIDKGLQKIRVDVPGWLVHVFRDAGSPEATAAGLPEQIFVSVTIGARSRRVFSIDIDRAIDDCQPYFEYGVDEWKHNDSVLSPVRNAIAAPRQLWRVLRQVPKEVGEAIGSLKSESPPKPSWSPDEVAAMRHTASILALRYELHPKEWEQGRHMAVQSLPVHAQQVVAGAIHVEDFEAMLMRAEVSTTITPVEAAEFRRQAGLAD